MNRTIRTLRSITVAELRELLEEQDDDMPVIFGTDYGDHHHTTQALPIRGVLTETTVTESAYSNSGFAVSEDDEDDRDGESTTYLLIQ
jgi:hypothetical protein